ncbi:unnamed protein product [Discosporangium mesarthrocarpum]
MVDMFLNVWKNSEPPIPPKTVYVIRHGESTHNAKSFAELGANNNDARYLDAALTAIGEDQADALADRIAEINPELVVTSPLSRAADTCLRACVKLPKDGSGPRFAVRKECSERISYSCDVGSAVAVLEERFPTLDFAGLEDRDAWWWTPKDMPERSARGHLQLLLAGTGTEPVWNILHRVGQFRAWLSQQPESKIVVFAHGAYLRVFLAMNLSSASVGSLNNCDVRMTRL